jgi:uncharacterized protein DUF4402
LTENKPFRLYRAQSVSSVPGEGGIVRTFVMLWLRTVSVVAALIATTGPAVAATSNVKVSAQVVKPLTVTLVQNLDLGTIALGTSTFSGAIVGISRTGAFTCPTSLVCTGPASVAKYNVAGSNGQVVRISAPNVTLVNQADNTKTLTMVVDSPGTVSLPNSGNKGVDFSLGGRITLSSTTAAGVYSGTFNVTVDY